jgi:hypothetical protein
MITLHTTVRLQLVKVKDDQKITHECWHSYDGSTPVPILHGETIGQYPTDFSPLREFWKVVGVFPIEDTRITYDD